MSNLKDDRQTSMLELLRSIRSQSARIFSASRHVGYGVLTADIKSNDKNGCNVSVSDLLAGGPCEGLNQCWILQRIKDEEDFHYIVQTATGLVLDADAKDVNQNGCWVRLWEKNGGNNQQWQISRDPELWDGNTFRFVNRASAKGLVLDMTESVQLWTDCGGINQRWIVDMKA